MFCGWCGRAVASRAQHSLIGSQECGRAGARAQSREDTFSANERLSLRNRYRPISFYALFAANVIIIATLASSLRN
jgi:hypothetical protein